jgi:hypothetical protein
MKTMNQRFYVNLSIITIALLISLSSALIVARPALASTQAACANYLTTSVCENACVPSDPNGCGVGQWSYYCSYKTLTIYMNGQKVGGFNGGGSVCKVHTNCNSTCQ